jgi:uncharacterized protein YndB with AHSA1/START domain
MTQATTSECVVSRVFDAPPELVYRAFTDPDQLARWWGPHGCSLPRQSIESDPTVGGHQRFTMVVAARPEVAFRHDLVFTEVVENRLLAGRMLVTSAPGHRGQTFENQLRIEFHPEAGGRTRVDLRQGPFSEQEAGEVHEAWLQAFDKLGSDLPAAGRMITISRVFDAPPELVYQAFTDPGQLARWFGPVGYCAPRDSISCDLRPGGHWRLAMTDENDPAQRSLIDATLTEVVENELLVGVQDTVGMPGTEGVVRMSLRLEFHPQAGGRTRLELTQGPFPRQLGEQTVTGWESSFTKLDALLSCAG